MFERVSESDIVQYSMLTTYEGVRKREKTMRECIDSFRKMNEVCCLKQKVQQLIYESNMRGEEEEEGKNTS